MKIKINHVKGMKREEINWCHLDEMEGGVMRVKVFSADQKECLGEGEITQRVTVFDDITTPEIKLDNGDTIYGFECWWIPVEEAERIEKQLKEQSDEQDR